MITFLLNLDWFYVCLVSAFMVSFTLLFMLVAVEETEQKGLWRFCETLWLTSGIAFAISVLFLLLKLLIYIIELLLG